MSANIYRHELRTRLASVAIWSLSLAAVILIFFSMFSSFANQAALMNDMLNSFPPELRSAFGLNNLDLSSLLGYFGYLFTFVQLCLAVQAGNYGFGLVSIEESELTADFLLSKPVTRTRVLTSKLLAAFSSLFITDLVVWGITFASVALFNGGRQYDRSTLILLLLSIFILQLLFLGVGLIISLLVNRVRSVTPYSLGLAFGSYILSAFSGIFADIKLEYITPFKHLDPIYIVQNAALNTPFVLIDAAVIVFSLAVSYWLYIRRDIPAVS